MCLCVCEKPLTCNICKCICWHMGYCSQSMSIIDNVSRYPFINIYYTSFIPSKFIIFTQNLSMPLCYHTLTRCTIKLLHVKQHHWLSGVWLLLIVKYEMVHKRFWNKRQSINMHLCIGENPFTCNICKL